MGAHRLGLGDPADRLDEAPPVGDELLCDELPGDGLADRFGERAGAFPPRLGGRTYGGCGGTVTPEPPVTANLIPAVPPLFWPTSEKCRAPCTLLGMT